MGFVGGFVVEGESFIEVTCDCGRVIKVVR